MPQKSQGYSQYYKAFAYVAAGYLFLNLDYFFYKKLSTYHDFIQNYLEKDLISHIEIQTVINGKSTDTFAYYTDIHKSTHFIQISKYCD